MSQSTISSNQESYEIVSLDKLPEGARLSKPIYDQNHLLLLAVGIQLSSSTIARLKNRGIESVLVHRADLRRWGLSIDRLNVAPTPARRKTDVEPVRGDRPSAEQWNRGQPGRKTPYASEQISQFRSVQELGVKTINDSLNKILSNPEEAVHQTVAISHQTLSRIRVDRDLTVSLNSVPVVNADGARKNLQVGNLAIAIGSRLGLPVEDQIALAQGCTFHSIGAIQCGFPDGVPDTSSPLRRLECHRFPTLAYELLGKIREIPSKVAMIAYQIHERCDGTGFPRGRKLNQIHILSRIASVANAFIAMISPRDGRSGILPYEAVVRLLKETSEGRFDPEVVRGLLETITLFPLGSGVQLNDGQYARVLRANVDNYTRPVVVTLNGQIIDLAESPNHAITRAIPMPHESQPREE